MTLDLVPELCSVKGVVVISQTKSECILKYLEILSLRH